MAYLYRHIRTDKDRPFYIGIGNDSNGNYRRAFLKSNRTNFWKSIAKKGYEVEILFDNISWGDACKKEVEFIKLYGRSDLGLGGVLVNMTDGGEGNVNGITKKTRQKMAAKLKGRKLPDWHREIIRVSHLGIKVPWCSTEISQYGLDGNFVRDYESIQCASRELNIQASNIQKVLYGERNHCGGFIFCKKGSDINERKIRSNRINISKKVINTDTGVIYDNIKKASEKEGINYNTLKNSLRTISKKRKNIIFYE